MAAGISRIVLEVRNTRIEVGMDLLGKIPEKSPFIEMYEKQMNEFSFCINRKSEHDNVLMGTIHKDQTMPTLQLDCDPQILREVLEYFAGNRKRLHVGDKMCGELLMEELAFFGLDHTAVCQSCKDQYLWQQRWADTQQQAVDWWSRCKLRPPDDRLPSCNSKILRTFFLVVTVISMVTIVFRPSLGEETRVENHTSIHTTDTKTQWMLFILVDLALCLVIASENSIQLYTSRDKLRHLTSPWNVLEWMSWLSTWVQALIIFCPYLWSQPPGQSVLLVMSYGRLLRLLVIWRYLADTFIGHKLKIFFISLILAWKELVRILLATVTFSLCMGVFVLYVDNSSHQFTTVLQALTWALTTVLTVGYGAHTFSLAGLLCSSAGIYMFSLVVNTVWAYCELTDKAANGCTFGQNKLG